MRVLLALRDHGEKLGVAAIHVLHIGHEVIVAALTVLVDGFDIRLDGLKKLLRILMSALNERTSILMSALNECTGVAIARLNRGLSLGNERPRRATVEEHPGDSQRKPKQRSQDTGQSGGLHIAHL